MLNRSVYLDIVKGVAIIMVVFTHSIQFGSGGVFYQENNFFADPLFKFVYGFHMPLFMVVSGYLFWGTILRHKPVEIVKIKIRSLLLPIATWQTLYLCILLILGLTVISVGWLYSYCGALWFLRSVLICSFIMLVGHVVFKDTPLFHVVVLVLLLIIPSKWLTGLHVFMYPYFAVGYYWNKWNGQERYRRLSNINKWCVLIVSLGLYFILWDTYDTPERSVYINGTCLLERTSVWIQLGIDVVRYIYGGLGIVMTMVAVDLWSEGRKMLSDSNLQKLLWLGRNTLGIYIFNFYTAPLLLLLPVESHYFYMVSILETVVMFMGAWTVIWLVRKHRISRLLFLGEM